MSVHEKMTAIADAIRGKTGGTDPLTLDQMAMEVAGIETGGGGDIAKAIVERTITEIDDDSITTLGLYAFYSCTALQTARLVNCTTHKGHAFYKCSSLTKIELPNYTGSLASSLAQACPALTFANVGFCSSLGYNTFYGTALDTLILRRTSVVTLPTDSAFTNVTGPITVYVPEAVIETYQTATNWSTLYTNGVVTFVALEGSEYE